MLPVQLLLPMQWYRYQYCTEWLRVERLTPTVDYKWTAEVPTVDLTIV